MKKLASILMLLIIMVGCAERVEETGAGGMTEIQVMSVVYRAVEEYEGQADPTIKTVVWEPTSEVVDGIKSGLYNINSQYVWQDKIFKIRLLLHQLPGKQYKLIRYHNITTGKELK